MGRNPGMVVCGNGEPDPWGYRYIGPFDGPDHARLWEQTVHKRAGKPCPFDHWIETLEAPTAIPALQDIAADDLATADVDEEMAEANREMEADLWNSDR